MARFSVRRVHFGRRPDAEADDDGEGLPTPARVKLAARRAAAGNALRAAAGEQPQPAATTAARTAAGARTSPGTFERVRARG
jgi:hypothetical protein